jgi:parallel beta-helix repeat protein
MKLPIRFTQSGIGLICSLLLAFWCVGGCESGTDPRDYALRVPDEFATIQAAIDSADPGQRVVVAPGIYRGKGNKNLTFRGKGIVLESEEGPDATIIDCEGSGRGFHFHDGETHSAVIRGFTIRNGRSSPGSAIYCDHSSPTISKCVIAENDGRNPVNDPGSPIFCDSASPIIIGCTITENITNSGGGGISVFGNSSPSVMSSIVWANEGRHPYLPFTVGRNSILTIVCSSVDVYEIDDVEMTGEIRYVGAPILDDPLFCDPGHGDFRLQRGSPCLPDESACGGIIGALGEGCPAPWDENPSVHRVPAEFRVIQSAMDAATNGDTILVAPGTYTGVRNRNIDFKGKNIVLLSQSGPESTILDCEDLGDGILLRQGETSSAVIQGFTIRRASQAVTCIESSPRIMDCIITDNTSGIALSGSSAQIRNCTVSRSSSSMGGSAVYIGEGSIATVENCIIERNWTSWGVPGIYLHESHLVISNSTLRRNSSDQRICGAIFCRGSTLEAIDCLIYDNSGYYGGGIFASDSDVHLSNCTIYGNISPLAGQITASDSRVLVERSIVWDAHPGPPSAICNSGRDTMTLACCSWDSTDVPDWDGCRGQVEMIGGQVFEDPMLCDPSDWQFGLQPGSACLPENSPCGDLIGALGLGCGGEFAVADGRSPRHTE